MARSYWMIVGMAGLLTAAVPARAASFDCARAATPVERQICADPALSDADAALGTGFEAALAASPTPQSLRASQRQWVTEARNKAKGRDALLAAYRERIGELGRQAAEAQAVRQSAAAKPLGTCLNLFDAQDLVCSVTGQGVVADAPGGPLRWQMQGYKDGDRDAGSAVVVVAAEGAAARVVTWNGGDGEMHDPPVLVRLPQGVLLDLPGMMDGTGHFSAETLFVFRDAAWRQVDTDSWLAQMAAKLPKGKEVWKGVYPDWAKMTAQTPLWKPTDGNCCPTAGSASATLKLDGDKIELVSLKVLSKPIQ